VSKGLKCDGYERQTTFIHASSDGPPPKKRQYRRHPRQEHEPSQETRVVHKSSRVPLAPRPVNDRCLAPSAYEETYFGVFWNAYLPGGRPITTQAMRYTGGGWTNILPQAARRWPSVRKILLAFGLATAGQVWDKRREAEEGLRYYVDSLRQMSGAIADPARGLNQGALCLVARLYSLYEVGS